MAATLDIVVRGQCACGRRYRIRNARPGVTVACPQCGRAIHVKPEDLKVAVNPHAVFALQLDAVEPREAIPLEYGELVVAKAGARPGPTGRTLAQHDEALLNRAMHGWVYASTPPGALPPAQPLDAPVPVPALARDLLASFYFAGSWKNAANVLLTAVACALPLLVAAGPLFTPWLWLVVPGLYLIVCVYLAHFYWSVLRESARGQDELTWVDTDPAWWSDGARALACMTLFAAFCLLPAAAVALALGPAHPRLLVGVAAAAVVGSFPWPVLIISVALGGTLAHLRPDRLLRCVRAMGTGYWLGWLTAIGAVAAGVALRIGVESIGGALAAHVSSPVARAALALPMLMLGFAVSLYVGYVHFRVLGLLFRHYGARFPWPELRRH